MTDIYEQHQATFKHVTAYVIMKDGERVATAAFRWGQAVTCYFHVIGIPMTRGKAGGGGYDRASAAAYAAICKAITDHTRPEMVKTLDAITQALYHGSEGSHWDRALQDAGFQVFQAV